MKKKIGTILDEELIFKAKQVALSQKQSFSQLLEEALRTYLLKIEKEHRREQENIVRKTRGVMRISPSVLNVIMEEEGIYEA